MPRVDRLVVSCEHGGNRVPRTYAAAFEGAERDLQGHRGYDPGALALARRLAGAFDAEFVYSTVSRLVVDLNRSLHHPRVFSEFTRPLPPEVRGEIAARHYHAHRRRIEETIGRHVRAGRRVVHVGVHTFVPRLHGQARNADVAFLYDPARQSERAFAAAWRRALRAIAPHWRVRRNYPYRGKADGLTTYLRKHFPPGRYLGIELEVNQRHAAAGARTAPAVRSAVVESLRSLLTR